MNRLVHNFSHLKCIRLSFIKRNEFSTSIRKVGVVGLGLMGHGIAQVVAQSGYEVVAIETSENAMNTGVKRIQDSLSKIITKDVQKGKYPSEAEGKKAYNTIFNRISSSTVLTNLQGCDLVIEAIAEDMNLKLSFYDNLSKNLQSYPNTIFASNTSSLPITGMAIASKRPDKFVGLHFFNPVQIMKLVEVIRNTHTDEKIFESMITFTQSIGKTPVRCKDTPGFIVNRLLVPYLAGALALVERGDASVTDVDISMQLGAGHPMGPLQLADYIGLDTILSILEGWNTRLGTAESDFKVPNILRNMVKQGDYGRKSGKGFYIWKDDKVVGPA